jgi:hypothetical protein
MSGSLPNDEHREGLALWACPRFRFEPLFADQRDEAARHGPENGGPFRAAHDQLQLLPAPAADRNG